MEENKIVALISTLAAGAVATVAVAMNWRKIHRAVGKAKKESLAHLKQLKATINHIRPHKPASVLRKKPKAQTEELVANKISQDIDGKGRVTKGNGSYDQKILDILTQNQKGFTLPEIGTNLGVPYIALAQPVKRLVAQSKLRREGKLYLLNQVTTPAVVQAAEAIAQNSSASEPSVTTQQPGEVKPQ